MRTGSGAGVQGFYPRLFVVLIVSSRILPRRLLELRSPGDAAVGRSCTGGTVTPPGRRLLAATVPNVLS